MTICVAVRLDDGCVAYDAPTRLTVCAADSTRAPAAPRPSGQFARNCQLRWSARSMNARKLAETRRDAG